MDALARWLGPVRYGDVRGTDVGALDAVIDGLVVRVVAGLRPACTGLAPTRRRPMAARLQATQSALGLLGHAAPRRRVARRRSAGCSTRPDVPGLRARAGPCRLLLDAELLDGGRRPARRLSPALTPGTPPAEGAAFVEGFLAGSGTVLLHDAALLGLVDEWLAGLPRGRLRRRAAAAAPHVRQRSSRRSGG